MKMNEVAKLAGVSVATVSRVLNEPEKVKPETRIKVENILRQTNYIANGVARGLAKKFSNTIGVMVVDIRDLYFADVTYNIERGLTELGFNVLLCNTGGSLGEKKKYLRLILEKQVDGLILVGSVFKESSDNKHILNAGKNVPIVMVNSILEGENIYSVVCDDRQGVKEAVDYLVDLGHEKIFYFNDIKTYSGLAKVEGFKEGMMAHNLNPENIMEISRDLNGGYSGVKRLISEERDFTAIITGEDITALGVIKALSTLQRKELKDVAVIGYNNSLLAVASIPALTSVDNMREAMAHGAVQMLSCVLQGKQTSKKMVLFPKLVVRESA